MQRLYQRWDMFLYDDNLDALLFEALHRLVRDVVVCDDGVDVGEAADEAQAPAAKLGGVHDGNGLLGRLDHRLVEVRFQGVRAIGDITNFCEVALEEGSPDIQVIPESLTGWVRHPVELNTYWDVLGPQEAAKRQPNMVRFQVIFDSTNALVPEVIAGVSEIFIAAQPD